MYLKTSKKNKVTSSNTNRAIRIILGPFTKRFDIHKKAYKM